MKFKRGEEVVLKVHPHIIYKVDTIDFSRCFEKYDRYYLVPLKQWVAADEVELAAIVGTPLYEALR